MMDTNKCQCRYCHKVRDDAEKLTILQRQRFVVCTECGNKRCPHATFHGLTCTGSNDSDQPGSYYGPPIWHPDTDPDEDSNLPKECETWLDAAVRTLCGFHPELRESADGCRKARAELTELRNEIKLLREKLNALNNVNG